MTEYTICQVGPKLVCAMYGKRKVGVGFEGGSGFLFIAPPPGETFDPGDFIIIQGMVDGYNARLEVDHAD